MRLTTWCGSVIETRDYGPGIWFRWASGWLRAGWRPSAFRSRAAEREGHRSSRTRTWITLVAIAVLAIAYAVIV